MGFKGFLLLVVFTFFCFTSVAQINLSSVQNKNKEFWNNVSFGGGLGLNFGDGFFYGSVSPSAIYNFSPQFNSGFGLSYSYLNDKRNSYRFSTYGASIISFYNPTREVQLSVELEGLQVDQTFFSSQQSTIKQSFFQEALFLGAGYRISNITIGGRYNVLHNKNRNIYGSAFLPFVRVYF